MTGHERALDAIVIGTGTAGLTVGTGLARFGRRVALIESARVGGESTNVGSIPAGRLIRLAHDPALRGDPRRVLEDVRAMRDRLSSRERGDLERTENIELITGRATLAPGRRVMVHRDDDSVRTLTAPHVVIATGSHPRRADIPGLPDARHLTNETLFDLREPPEHMAIVGAGAFGVEMACAFARLGTRVSLIERGSWILPEADPEAAAVLAASLRRQGVDLHTDSRPVAYEPEGGVLTVGEPAGDRDIGGVDAVLSAVGRVPNADVAAGVVAIGPRGISVDSWGRTSEPGVWAVGDVTPWAHQAHGASAMARRVVQRIAFPWMPALGRPPVMPSDVFSDPEVAWVGPGAAERARRFVPGALTEIRIDLPATDRGLTDDVHHGFVAVSAARGTGRVIAATIVGPHASEMLPLLTHAVAHGTSLLRLRRLVYAYPTHAAAIGAVADEFARRTLPHLHSELAAWGGRRVVGGMQRARDAVNPSRFLRRK
jgi:pyruvate/2-oxoglutarate dehydrogenase complex dihydrolipoamide dehydrogenase (E3) component